MPFSIVGKIILQRPSQHHTYAKADQLASTHATRLYITTVMPLLCLDRSLNHFRVYSATLVSFTKANPRIRPSSNSFNPLLPSHSYERAGRTDCHLIQSLLGNSQPFVDQGIYCQPNGCPTRYASLRGVLGEIGNVTSDPHSQSTPLCVIGAVDETRTRNNLLGRQMLCQLNYYCIYSVL